ncbi:MAG TPA: hypothetical protein RMH99_22745 [Sandaracinaceae bacterium LLY-WYZ-13_1]|nr:hypothetical protein [Sandaracinaceae bacterium LLY-WYZ-13_1]
MEHADDERTLIVAHGPEGLRTHLTLARDGNAVMPEVVIVGDEERAMLRREGFEPELERAGVRIVHVEDQRPR